MILTYKVKHERNFSGELDKARAVAKYALEHKTLSSKDVKHIGLKSIISNQILRKYSRNKNLKRIKHVNVHKKYKNIRRRMQKAGKHGVVKRLKRRESRIVRDLNHKISREGVDTVKEEGSGIKLEKLKGIRKTASPRRTFRYSLYSWSFYQLQDMIEYKARLLGVPIEYVDPTYSSQRCSRCGGIGKREGKVFNCPRCGAVDHADVNAAFNIASYPSIDQFVVDRDATKGSTDTPGAAMVGMPLTAEPPML